MRENRTHGSKWQGLETDEATVVDLGAIGKPAWNRSATHLRLAPRQPLTLHGFRPGRSAHNALDALAYAVERRKVSWVVEVDIRQYFGSIDREQLMQFLETRIGDRRVLRLIRKWLNAGVIEAGLEVDVVRGTPQGAVISPLLANVYLHHVLDGWFARQWRPREARGEVYIVRYADDFVLGLSRRQAAREMSTAAMRSGSWRQCGSGSRVSGWKCTRRRRACWSSAGSQWRTVRSVGKAGRRRSASSGFTHYCRTTRNGGFGLGRKPVAKRVRRTLKAVARKPQRVRARRVLDGPRAGAQAVRQCAATKAALRKRMHEQPVTTGTWLGQVLRGWLGYYAVPTSYPALRRFARVLKRLWLRALRKRSQRDRFSWERLDALCGRQWPRVSILHPWPAQRFAVTHSR